MRIEIIIALVGSGSALLGALIGAGSAYLLARREWRREDRFRYSQERRQMYANFVGLAEKAYRSASSGQLRDETSPAFHIAYTQTLLLASQPVKQGARALYNTVWAAEEGENMREYAEATFNFIEAVQAELGIPHESQE